MWTYFVGKLYENFCAVITTSKNLNNVLTLIAMVCADTSAAEHQTVY